MKYIYSCCVAENNSKIVLADAPSNVGRCSNSLANQPWEESCEFYCNGIISRSPFQMNGPFDNIEHNEDTLAVAGVSSAYTQTIRYRSVGFRLSLIIFR